MMLSFTYGRQVLEFVKDKDHFMLVYPNTPTDDTTDKKIHLISVTLEYG